MRTAMALLLSLALFANPGRAVEVQEEVTDFLSGTGSGGGASITWFPMDFSSANQRLDDAGLLAIPAANLYWGGGGWGTIQTGERSFIALGGGGFGGGSEGRQGKTLTRWALGAGYFSIKGIYALNKRIFCEAGLQLGGGSATILTEEADPEQAGAILTRLRGERTFALLRPQVGLDLRLARWAGILVEGGYSISSGGWALEGADDLVGEIDLGKGDGPYVSFTVRFGI